MITISIVIGSQVFYSHFLFAHPEVNVLAFSQETWLLCTILSQVQEQEYHSLFSYDPIVNNMLNLVCTKTVHNLGILDLPESIINNSL